MNKFMKTLWKDESGQGMAEYVLLIVVVLAVAAIFKERILGMVRGKMADVSGKFESFGGE